MADDEVFRCQNLACRCEVRVLKASIEGASNPKCVCGAEMKKPYGKPTLRVLKVNAPFLAGDKAGRG